MLLSKEHLQMSALPRGSDGAPCAQCIFPPRAVELWTWLMPPSDNGHHRMNKPPHLDAFVQTIGDVSLSRRVQIFYHKNPRSSSRQLNMGYLSWGKWMCFAENCDLWSILDSLNKAIHLSIILPYVNVIVFSPSRCHVYKYNSFYLYSLFSSVLRHLQHLVLTITRTWSSLNGLYSSI